jgi:hypothetical protein
MRIGHVHIIAIAGVGVVDDPAVVGAKAGVAVAGLGAPGAPVPGEAANLDVSVTCVINPMYWLPSLSLAER